MNYYNENDPFAAAWLRELIKDGLIAPGEVDERSICDVKGSDTRGFTQVHWFAGIGGWSYALRLAGWPDDRAVWTGSCPCQPFSAAGKRGGVNDKRHLWPEMRRLIGECCPTVVFGEQVASKDGRLWLAGVRADLEALGYGVGAADLCAAGVGAPHIRQRLYWVADSEHAERRPECEAYGDTHGRYGLGGRSDVGGVADADGGNEGDRDLQLSGEKGFEPQDNGVVEWMGDASTARLQERSRSKDGPGTVRLEGQTATAPSLWGRDFIPCADGKARRVEPGIFPLAHGVPNRVGTLRGAGNAIVPQVAAEFISAYASLNDNGPPFSR